LTVLADMPDAFEFGTLVAQVAEGRIKPLDEYALRHYLGGVINYYRYKVLKDGPMRVDLDPPQDLVKTLGSDMVAKGIKKLVGLSTVPTLRPDGTVLDTPGYDAASEIFYAPKVGDPIPTIPRAPTKAETDAALATLMHPFNKFPFATDLDRAVLLAALLTAAMRPALDTAPGFGFDAPTRGSGKTKLAMAIGALATGEMPHTHPHIGKDENEVRKRIMSVLLGGGGLFLTDNVVGDFHSPAFAALLTSVNYTDRRLGGSTTPVVPNRLTVLFTGCNLTMSGDLARRVLNCRIDPNMEDPGQRKFDLEPVSYCLTNRVKMVAAALTLVRGYLSADEALDDGSTASFEMWDAYVRQTVQWYTDQDVREVIVNNREQDPEKEAMILLWSSMHAAFGDGNKFSATQARELIRSNTDLIDAVVMITGREGVTNSTNGIGAFFKYRNGVINQNLRLDVIANPKTGNRYKIKKISL
jgi:hypothetical protein